MSADNQQERTQEGKLYRVIHSRHDIPESIYARFRASSDSEAQRKFERYKHEPSLQWDWLKLVRVDQEEITTNVAFYNPSSK